MCQWHLKRTRYVLVGGILILVLVGIGESSLRRAQVPVTTATAHVGLFVVRVITNGTVEPTYHLEVRAGLAAQVLAVPDAGSDEFERGGTLLRLDDTSVRAALARAQSQRLAAQQELEKARAARDLSHGQLTADKYLYDQRALTRERYEQSKAESERADARVRSLEKQVARSVEALDAQIAQLTTQAAAATVRAPFSGTVYHTQVKVGEVVQPGAPLLWFADLRHLRVRANIDQTDLGRVRVGDDVEVTAAAYPGRSWSGRVSEMIPDVVVKASRAVSEGLVVLEPPVDGLVPGMNVDLDITVTRAPQILQVPNEAIFSERGETVVYRVENGTARRVLVETGRASVTDVEITQGLRDGDVVILGPAEGLSDGTRVVQRPLGPAHL